MNNLSVFFVVLFVNGCFAAQLPASFKKCNRKQPDFNDCLTQAVSDAVHQLTKPIPEAGLVSLEPLNIPKVMIGSGTSAVKFSQDFKNMKVKGLTTYTMMKANMDFDKMILHIDAEFPEIRLDFDYVIDGKVMVMPIKGKGTGYVIVAKPSITVTFSMEEGKKRYKIVKTKMVYHKIDGLTVQFNDLFDGDKTLGDGVNKVINDNWAAVFDDIKGGYEEASAVTLEAVFNGLLAKIPVSELW